MTARLLKLGCFRAQQGPPASSVVLRVVKSSTDIPWSPYINSLNPATKTNHNISSDDHLILNMTLISDYKMEAKDWVHTVGCKAGSNSPSPKFQKTAFTHVWIIYHYYIVVYDAYGKSSSTGYPPSCSATTVVIFQRSVSFSILLTF